MEVTRVESSHGEGAYWEARVAREWRGDRKDGSGSDLFITEMRTTRLSKPRPRAWQVDTRFELRAPRAVAMNGDLQHAGVDFRAVDEVSARRDEVHFLWEPDLPPGAGKVVSPDFKWCLMRFLVGGKNSPSCI